jgi:hypothetical protein
LLPHPPNEQATLMAMKTPIASFFIIPRSFISPLGGLSEVTTNLPADPAS